MIVKDSDDTDKDPGCVKGEQLSGSESDSDLQSHGHATASSTNVQQPPTVEGRQLC